MPVSTSPAPRALGPAAGEARKPAQEPVLAQIASFVDLFVWLIILKTFFTPIFQIPTGSMAHTLFGQHANHVCPNCGWEYPIGPTRTHNENGVEKMVMPNQIMCPNCRWSEPTAGIPGGLTDIPGDRIIVHGWPYDFGGFLAPQRWDVIVFKNPSDPDQNYIKRLIGLPGETLEIIDGDVFVKKPGETDLRVARKTRPAQDSLWMPYFDQNFLPRMTSMGTEHPRWEAVAGKSWDGLQTRRITFAAGKEPESIQFLTHAATDPAPCVVQDIYGYDPGFFLHEVTDVRIGADVEFASNSGFIEFQLSKYQNLFIARLFADGKVTLEREDQATHERTQMDYPVAAPPARRVHFSIGHADYQVVVEVDHRPVIATTPEQYDTSAEAARKRNLRYASPIVRIAASDARGSLSNLRVDRDVHYRGDNDSQGPPNVGEGRPLTLGNEYFPMGDNSPASLDGRYWRAASVGPHLRKALNEGRYTVGTVPADQMIGKAFLVYFPGMPHIPGAPDIRYRGIDLAVRPDLGHVRWIH